MPGLRIVLAAFAVALVATLAACGGSKQTATTTASASPSEQWAGGVCTALVTWKTSVQGAAKSVRAEPAKATLQTALDQVEAATRKLVDTVDTLEGPQTTAVTSAKKTVSTLGGQLQSGAATIRRTIEDTAAAGGIRPAAETVQTTLRTMQGQMQSAADDLRALDKGELRQAFEQAPACASLTGSSANSS